MVHNSFTKLNYEESSRQPSEREDNDQAFQKDFDKSLQDPSSSNTKEEMFINTIINQKWYAKVRMAVTQEYIITVEALIDLDADLNCLSEGSVPSKYFTKTTQILNTANGGKIPIWYKLSDVVVCLEGDLRNKRIEMIEIIDQQ